MSAAARHWNRRLFLQTAGVGSLALLGGRLPTGSGLTLPAEAFAEELQRTAAMGEGPFYPDRLPLDTDNDLIIINDSLTPAVGEVTHLSGRILDAKGEPLRNAFVEIWQVDAKGVYLHSGSSNAEGRDRNFQGYGRFLTDSRGRYYFRTVKPVPYPGRTPHIHFGVSLNGQRVFTTQMLIAGHPQNARDGLFRRLSDPADRRSVQAEFKPLPDSKIGELAVNFDLVLGVTPADLPTGRPEGGIGKPERATRRRPRPGRPRP